VSRSDNSLGCRRHPTARSSFLVIACVAITFGARDSSAQTFHRTIVDSMGQLRLELANQIIQQPKDSGQVAFEQVALSPDRRIVGWVALYPNCCTSYPIPLRLVLRQANGDRMVIENELPIWQGAFASDGRSARTGQVLDSVDVDSSTSTALPACARAAMPPQSAKPPLFNER